VGWYTSFFLRGLMKRFTLVILTLLLAAGVLFFNIRPKNQLQPWMKEQIKDDLSFYQPEDLKSKKLKDWFKNANPNQLFVYYQIKDNKVYWARNWSDNESIDRVRKTTRMFDRMTKIRKFPDMEFLLTIHDAINSPEAQQQLIPLFTYAKTETEPGVLIPDPLTEGFSRRSRRSISKANKRPKYAWKNKVEIAFWRGGTTGNGPYQLDNWFNHPRSKLALLTKYYPDLIDSGFTTFAGVDALVKQEMENNLSPVSWTVHKDHLKYKYLVVPDGNTCTYPRYYLGLYSNSAVIKQDSDQIQWFYRALKPYVHYLPVASDFCNLPEQIQWAQENDSKMKLISKNASEFVNGNLLPKHLYAYVEALLIEYASLQSEEITLLEDAKPFSSFKEEK